MSNFAKNETYYEIQERKTRLISLHENRDSQQIDRRETNDCSDDGRQSLNGAPILYFYQHWGRHIFRLDRTMFRGDQRGGSQVNWKNTKKIEFLFHYFHTFFQN